jgi:hypothetical protein
VKAGGRVLHGVLSQKIVPLRTLGTSAIERSLPFWWNENWQGKPALVPLCPTQIPHDLNWDRNRAAAVGSQRLAA